MTSTARKQLPTSPSEGVLSGAQQSAGTDNLDGTWTLTPAELAGLTVTTPADSDADFTLTVSATSTEADGAAATTLANLDVPVTGVADVPTVDVVAASRLRRPGLRVGYRGRAG